MPLSDLLAFVERIRSSAPVYDWKPTIPASPPPERRLKSCALPSWYDGYIHQERAGLYQTRIAMRRAMREYCQIESPDYMLLILAMPGTGKTQAAAELIDELITAGQRVAYAGPRHAFYDDVTAKSSNPGAWYEWLPRQSGDEESGRVETCRYSAEINTWMIRGYEPMDFCSGVCGWDYVKICPFHRQKERAEPVIYIQHQHVTLGHPLEFGIAIGDENPTGAFMHDWEIPSRWVMPPGMDMADPITEIYSRLGTICDKTPRPVAGAELMDGLGGVDAVIQALENFDMPLDALALASPHVPEDANRAPYFHLPQSAALLLREARAIKESGDCIQRVIASDGTLHLITKRKPSENLPRHLIWLDATGRPEIYERLFERRVKVFDASPALQGKIYQVIDRANGKGAISPSKAAKQAEEKRHKKPLADDWEPLHAQQAKAVIGRIIQDHGYQSPSIISFMGLNLGEIDARFGYFYASRGTNAHQEADAIFILGTPQPSIYEIVKTAKMIYFDRDRPFDTSWYANDVAYTYKAPDGLGRSYPVSGFWNDPDLNAVLFAYREDEIVQAAHRCRPVNHEADIWLLTNVPIHNLPPDQLLTMRELMDAPEGVDLWKWQAVKKLIDDTPPGGTIGTQDIIRVTGCHRETAIAYRKLIAELDGWHPAKITVAQRGQPQKCAQKAE